MDLHFDKTTGKANEVVEKDLASYYREAVEKITNYLSLEFFGMKEIPSDVFDEAHKFIGDIRADFINKLMYYYSHYYITSIDYNRILKSFNESIAQLEDIYLYKTIYEKSSFHYDSEQVWRTPVCFLCYRIKFNFYFYFLVVIIKFNFFSHNIQ